MLKVCFISSKYTILRSNKTKHMKTLLIEKTTVGNSECEVIMLTDMENKRSSYIYTNEVNYQVWVIEEANGFRDNGYKIFNNTEIKLNDNLN